MKEEFRRLNFDELWYETIICGYLRCIEKKDDDYRGACGMDGQNCARPTRVPKDCQKYNDRMSLNSYSSGKKVKREFNEKIKLAGSK